MLVAPTTVLVTVRHLLGIPLTDVESASHDEAVRT